MPQTVDHENLVQPIPDETNLSGVTNSIAKIFADLIRLAAKKQGDETQPLDSFRRFSTELIRRIGRDQENS